ncbi:MAG: sugar phosphate isomerase/epimerase [Lachnospiraceae bacterium]|nr:sugar phosphate isomerase/epimerase [Lachnospiraceae bacterium]
MKHCYALATPDIPPEDHVFGLNGDFTDNLRQIKACGYDGADLVVCDPRKLDALAVAQQIEQMDMIVPMICTGEIVKREGLELTSPDPDIRRATVQRFYDFIDLASLVGSGVNIGRSRGCIHAEMTKAETDALALDSFEKITVYAEKRSVKLALEPVTKQMVNYLNTLEDVLTLVRRIDSPNFGYMLDTQHMILDEPDPARTIMDYASNALHIHLVDDNRGPVGCGLIHFDEVIGMIRASGYNGTFAHEGYAPGFELEAMRQSMRIMKPIFEMYA